MKFGIAANVAFPSFSLKFRLERHNQVEGRSNHRQELSMLTGEGKLRRLRLIARVRQILCQDIVTANALNGGRLATNGDCSLLLADRKVDVDFVIVIVAKV